MNRFAFFFRTAWTNMIHSGQRALVAVLCVAFGAMSLIAMTVLSDALERMLVINPQDMIGADISASRAVEDVILPEHVTELEKLRQEGVISAYTLAAYTPSLTFHLPGSGELHFPGAGIGIDPAAYPPAGKLTVDSPGAAGIPTLLQEPGDALVSRDLMLEYGLATGDLLVISDLAVGIPTEVRIRGVVVDTPNHQGSKIYYNLDTAAQLAAGSPSLNTMLALSDRPALAKTRLRDSGWNAYPAADLYAQDAEIQDLFEILFNGAGVLGLLVSGVGIANTMQVLLRRRRREVAVWKTLGYQSGDLLILFSLEAALLGLFGSLLGTALGVAVSAALVDLFSRTSTLLIVWSISPEPVILAVLVSVATTVVFALWAIVISSRVPPVALLRDAPSSTANMPWFQAVGLLLVLGVPFTAVISKVMGSWLYGIGVLAFALGGLVVLGGALGGLLWLFVRVLPLRAAPLLNMARSNLRRRGMSPVFAMIALFVGVVALSTAAVVTQNASRVMSEKAPAIEGDNLVIMTAVKDVQAVQDALAALKPDSFSIGYQTRVRAIRKMEEPREVESPFLIAREEPGEYQIQGAAWGSRTDGVYLYSPREPQPGAAVEITLWDGSTHVLPVIGTYDVDFSSTFRPELGVLLPVELSQSLAAPETAQIYARIPPVRLASTAQNLGGQLPHATVINLVAYAARFTSQYHNLFVFAISMASLALLAGALLMANSVSLAMLDRRYEIGVLKAMGYARRHVLVTLVVEYAMIALLACTAGLVLVRVFLWLLGLRNVLAARLLVMTPLAASAVMLAALTLTVVTVLAVTWKPTRVSPLVVLNDRE